MGAANRKPTDSLVKGALIAALYTVLSALSANWACGVIQFRISEVLTLLPVVEPSAIAGLALGCVVSNIYEVAMGQTFLWDVVVGSLATLVAAVLTYKFRRVRVGKMPLLSALPPVVINAVVIGTMNAVADCGLNLVFAVWLKCVCLIAASEFVLCFFGGVPLVMLLKKTIYKGEVVG